jgi:hypothetical protein
MASCFNTLFAEDNKSVNIDQIYLQHLQHLSYFPYNITISFITSNSAGGIEVKATGVAVKDEAKYMAKGHVLHPHRRSWQHYEI